MTSPTQLDVDDWTDWQWEDRLRGDPFDGTFSDAEVKDLPEPVRRFFRAAIAVGTPLATGARLDMRGQIKVGGRWLPFRAHEVVNPHVGFLFSARAAGVITGSDRYIDGAGAMNWKIAGLFSVAHGTGPDISVSGAGRTGVEAILVPTSLLPRYGVTWTVDGDHHIVAHHELDSTPVELHLTIAPSGHIRAVVVQRWGDPDETGTWAWHPFGGDFTAHRTLAGLTIASAGHLGWHYGTDRQATGEFFRYEITSLELLAGTSGWLP
jgi:hypothetical protein